MSDKLKIIALSDLHIGKWNGFGERKIQQVIERTNKEKFDVFLFNGDLAEPNYDSDKRYSENFFTGIHLISQINTKHKFFVLGNNDLELFSNSSNIIHDIESYLSDYDIHLLDLYPKEINGITFLGAFLGWNGDLWKPSTFEKKEWPATFEECQDKANIEYKNIFKNNSDYFGSNEKYFNFHLDSMKQTIKNYCLHRKDFIMCTHTVPSADFVKYGHSEKFDYLNFYMGYNLEKVFKPEEIAKMLLHISGHTHRTHFTYSSNGIPLINISSNLLDRKLELPKIELVY